MKFLTFGEIMLRLKAPGMTRLLTDHYLEATFGGGEANVAVSLANYGMDVGFLTVLPDNPITDACVRELRGFGVDTSRIVTGNGRFGVYYVEGGANQLPSRVVYDRAWSAIAMAKPGDIDWDKAFAGVEWFHITGITRPSASPQWSSAWSPSRKRRNAISPSPATSTIARTCGNTAKRPARSCVSLQSTSMLQSQTKRMCRRRSRSRLM